MRSVGVVLAVLYSTCTPTQQTGEDGGIVGCGKDTDCKGSRICVDGTCIDPPATQPDLGPGDGPVLQDDGAADVDLPMDAPLDGAFAPDARWQPSDGGSCRSNADCPYPGQTCQPAGTCACPAGQAVCGGMCID